MEWLNYHHLLYFWTVAREGSIAKACKKLHLAQPTISGQLRSLEESIGEKLLARRGRGLVLTDTGHVVFGYAQEIFGLGRELQDVLQGRPSGRALRLVVGISDVVPKLIAYRILRPVLAMTEGVQMVCDEGPPEQLLGELAEHRLDVVLSDGPVPPSIKVKAFSHLLGTSKLRLFGAPALAARYRRRFPASLDGAPFLVPMDQSDLRRQMEEWFDAVKIRPRIAGEFKDRALMTTFGQAGAGVFAAPAAIEREMRSTYKVSAIGSMESVVERFYAISIERKLKHPAVVAISEAAKADLFHSSV